MPQVTARNGHARKAEEGPFPEPSPRKPRAVADPLPGTLFEDGHVVMLLIDPEDGSIHDANPAACRFYGWDRETLRTIPWTRLR